MKWAACIQRRFNSRSADDSHSDDFRLYDQPWVKLALIGHEKPIVSNERLVAPFLLSRSLLQVKFSSSLQTLSHTLGYCRHLASAKKL
jgi:hypothetical protein